MPVTVAHSLTATTPDDPAYEIRPSHWNSNHVATVSAVGSEISGAFSNAGNVTFGLETNGYITASANAAGAGDGFNRISAGSQLAGTNNTIVFSNSNGVTFGMSNSSVITASHNGLTTAAASDHSHGNPTLNLTNLSGTTASNSAGFTLSLSAATGLTSQSNQAVSANNGSYAFQTLSFSNANGVSFGTSAGSAITASHNGLTTARASNDAVGLNTAQSNVTWTVNSSGLSLDARGYAGTGTSATNASVTLNSNGLAVSVAAPGAATLTVSAVGNTTVNSSGTWPGALSLRAYGVLSAGTSNGSLLLSTPDAVDYTYLSVGASNLGNTAGNTGMASQRLVIVGSDNITLSGSTNGGSATLSIIGGAGGGGGAAISAGTQSVSTGTVVWSNSNNITFGMSGSSRVTASAALNLYATGNTTNNSSTVLPIGSVLFNAHSPLTAGFSNGSMQLSAPATSSLVAGANITVSTDGSTISIIGGAGGAGFSAGVSNVGNTAGDTGMTATRLVLVGSNNVTLSQTTGANGATVTILGANTHAQQTGISGIVASDATYTSGSVYFSNQNGVTVGSSVDGASQYVRLSVATSYAASNHSHGNPTLALTNLSGTTDSNSAGFTLSLSAAAPGGAGFSAGVSNGGNTAGDTGVTGTRLVFAGGNNITVSQGTDANGATVTFSGVNTVAQTNQTIGGYFVGNTTGQSSSSTVDARSLSFDGAGIVSAGWSNGTVRISATQSNQAFSAGAASSTFQTLSFQNSNGVSFSNNAGAIRVTHDLAGTGTTFNGANISGSMTVNSGGVQLSMSVAAPGAAAESNAVHLLGANTAGNTTATGSTIGYSGINLTLSGTNGSVVNISAPATSSLVGTGGISLSTNGSTISISGPTIYGTNPFPPGAEVILGQLGQSTLHFVPLEFPANVAVNAIQVPIHFTGATNSTGQYTISQGLGFYTRVNSTQLSLYTSIQGTVAFTHSGTNNSSLNVGGYRTWSGTVAAVTLPASNYVVGFLSRTSSSSANATISHFILSNINTAMSGALGAANDASNQFFPFQGSYSAQTGAFPNSIGGSEINGSAAVNLRLPIWNLLRT